MADALRSLSTIGTCAASSRRAEVTKFVRLDEDHYALLVDPPIRPDAFEQLSKHAQRIFEEYWPGKKMLVMIAEDFVDLTGQYELVPQPQGLDA